MTNRQCFTRQFAVFMVGAGYTAFVLPPTKIVKSSFVPYIFTSKETSTFFTEIDNEPPRKGAYLKHFIYPTLFRMLYGCGFRISEVLHLKVADVDLETGVVTIRNSKFNSQRLVPMADSLTSICRSYFNKVLLSADDSSYFFPARDGGFICTQVVADFFKYILGKAGIPNGVRGKGARLHDLRHTFAVHALNKLAQTGEDIYTILPVLSTYMGHATISATASYLRLTAEVYPDIINIVNEYYSDIVPEVIEQ